MNADGSGPPGVTFDVRKWMVLSQGGRGCAESGASSGGRKLSQSQGEDSEGQEDGTKGIGGVGGGVGWTFPGAGSDILPSNQLFHCGDYIFFPSEL